MTKSFVNDPGIAIRRDVQKVLDASQPTGYKTVLTMLQIFSLRPGWGYAHSLRLQRAAASSEPHALATVAHLTDRIAIARPVPGAVVLAVAMAALLLNIDRLQALAQAPNADQPRFDVASIKINRSNSNEVFRQEQNGRHTLSGFSLAMLIQSAYQAQEFQVIGGPAWMESTRFDIVATEPPGSTGPAAAGAGAPGPGQPRPRDLMLRALLEERFRLAVHRETRERPVYALVRARSDGRLGPALKPSSVDCATAKGVDACGTRVGPGYIRVRGVTMPQLATTFSRLGNTGSSLNRLVVDGSGLEGRYDADVRFTPEIEVTGPVGSPAIDPNGPSIFTAVQEQLGLKLDPQRGPVEVLVIDRVEMPTEN